MTKICTKCGVEKELGEFHKQCSSKDGLRSICKFCRIIYSQNNKEKISTSKRKTRQKYKDKIREYESKYKPIYYQNNIERFKQYKHEYYLKNKESIQQKNKLNYQKNKENIYKHLSDKRKNDIEYSLLCKLRSRINSVIKSRGVRKAHKSIELLGCTVKECREHLEKQFKEGMSWDNHGLYGWHIDHIKPCALFDLTDPEQQKQCFHYTNLQPLWAEDNLRKGDTYDEKDN